MSQGTLRKRGQVWYGRVTHNGRQFERCLKTGSKAVARERLADHIAKLKLNKWGEEYRPTFDEAVTKFAEEHFRVIRPSSARRYQASLMQLIDHFGGRYLDEIDSDNLYLYEMNRRRKVQPPTIRRDFACLSMLFKLAKTWRWAKVNPVREFMEGRHSLTENPPRNRNLDHAEESALIHSAHEWWNRAPSGNHYPVPWHIIVPVAIDSGLRQGELFSLQRNINVRLDRQEFFVAAARAKSNRERRVPILPRSQELLASLPAFLGSPWIFHRKNGKQYSPKSPYVWESFQKIVRNAGLENVTFHDLRRTCGCRLLRDRRMSLEEVSKWLGHSSVQVTERVYAFLEVDQLHKAVERTRDNIVPLPEVDNRWTRVGGFSNKSVRNQKA